MILDSILITLIDQHFLFILFYFHFQFKETLNLDILLSTRRKELCNYFYYKIDVILSNEQQLASLSRIFTFLLCHFQII